MPQDQTARFWAKVDSSNPDGCWLWTAALDDDGYGRFRLTDRPGVYRHVKAHRHAYTLTIGPIPDGLITHTPPTTSSEERPLASG